MWVLYYIYYKEIVVKVIIYKYRNDDEMYNLLSYRKENFVS